MKMETIRTKTFRSPAEWEEIYRKCVEIAKQGDSIQKFCRENKIPVGSLYAYMAKMGYGNSLSKYKPGGPRVAKKPEPKLTKFVPEGSARTNGHYPFEVEFKGGTKLRFDNREDFSEIVRRLAEGATNE